MWQSSEISGNLRGLRTSDIGHWFAMTAYYDKTADTEVSADSYLLDFLDLLLKRTKGINDSQSRRLRFIQCFCSLPEVRWISILIYFKSLEKSIKKDTRLINRIRRKIKMRKIKQTVSIARVSLSEGNDRCSLFPIYGKAALLLCHHNFRLSSEKRTNLYLMGE